MGSNASKLAEDKQDHQIKMDKEDRDYRRAREEKTDILVAAMDAKTERELQAFREVERI